jgi:acetolactate synthase-1/2/3 large subunit
MHSTNKWTLPKQGTRIIHIDIDPEEIGKNYKTAVGIAGDAKLSLKAMIAAIKSKEKQLPKPDKAWLETIKQRTKEWYDLVFEQRSSSAVPIKPQRLMKEINDFLGPEDILVADVSFSSVWATIHYNIRSAGRKVITCRGFTPVGWGFPAAIGVTLGAPGRKVLGMVGDGSFAFGIGELETISRCQIPAVTIVMNNSMLGYEKFIVKYFTKPGEEQTKIAGMDFSDTNYADVARAFGCAGFRVENPNEIRPALQEAFGSRKPTLIDVKIDPDVAPPIDYFPEKVRNY